MANGTETFKDAITEFANRSLHMYVGHAMGARGQFMTLQDFQLMQGWTTASDRKIRQWLVKLDRIRRKITHLSGDFDQDIEGLEELAAELEIDLPTAAETKSVGDSIARPSGRPMELRFKLDGTDVNIPSISQMSIRNTDAYTLIQALDLHVVSATRLDARMATHRITPEESMMLFAGLHEMWSICDECGGDDRIVGVTNGVKPSEEPQGPKRSVAIKGDETA